MYPTESVSTVKFICLLGSLESLNTSGRPVISSTSGSWAVYLLSHFGRKNAG